MQDLGVRLAHAVPPHPAHIGDAFFLHILEAADDRHYVAHDARAESRNILCVIAVARLAAICKLGEECYFSENVLPLSLVS